MSHTHLIEVDGRTAGIIVGDRAGYRFYSDLRRFSSLNGHIFHDASDAERAARRLLKRSARSTPLRHGAST